MSMKGTGQHKSVPILCLLGMKQKVLSLLLTVFALAPMAEAKPVEPSIAMRIAQNLLHKSVVDATPDVFSECYLFVGADGEGFVLLSADDCVFPLLGYSRISAFPIDDMPDHLVAWIDGYQRDIVSIKALGGLTASEITAEWQRLLEGTPKSAVKASEVMPLIETKWKQSEPYANRCPFDSVANKHAVTGCVATATAQVMRYWGHPAQGRGSHSYDSKNFGFLSVCYDTSVYDWENMPKRVLGYSPQVQKDAVSKLCYEVGVSMDMNYSVSASGAYEHSGGMLKRSSAELALENHFGYNPGMYAVFKEGMTDEQWVDLIASELDAGRPIIYTGSSSTSGHAFVVDGYNVNGLFHINWGWGGSFDGYYTLTCLAIGTQGSSDYTPFNEMNNALIHVYPVTPNDSISVVSVVSANSAQGTVRGSGTYPVGSDRVMLYATANPGYRFDHWASGNTANPIFYYPTLDYSDTAYFAPLRYDTLGYSQHFVPNFDTLYSLGHCEWGIRIAPDRLPAGKQLEKVMNFIYTTGQYVLRIYNSDLPAGAVYEDTLELSAYGWRTITLNHPVTINASMPLWITFTTENVVYPAGICPNTGVIDGSWIKHDGMWEVMDTNTMGYYTWSILGIVGDLSGICEASLDRLTYTLDGLSLTVSNRDGRAVALYDLQGRQLTSFHSPLTSLRLPTSGVYLLQADGLPARRIVAVKK